MNTKSIGQDLYDTALQILKQGDMEEGISKLCEAALLGNDDAQNEAGVLYLFGIGVQQDADIAANYFTQAAVQGNATALSNIGTLYAQSERYDAAIGYWLAAAALNSATAINNLGCLHATGVGVPQNMHIAGRYFQRAAALGHLEAMVNLATLIREYQADEEVHLSKGDLHIVPISNDFHMDH